MNNIGTYLVDELIKEIENITDYVVVYSGRFQPFHKGHFSTYQNLVKKFGKGNVYIGTSDKTDKLKSPFNFKEKQTIMTKMFGIPSNRIVEIKNPYVPTEILKKFDKDTTAFVTVVGEKDEQRLGGKYFTPYKGVFDAGYGDKGYVYISPSQPNAISGTDVRNWLGKGEIEDRKKLFSKAYPKFDEKIFNLIVKRLDSLNESIFIPKEIIEYWATYKLNDFLKEVSLSNAGGVDVAKDVDDGPNFFFPNYDTFDIASKGRAEQIGYTVFKQIMSGDLEDYYEHPIYPNGPVKSVTPFPAGVIGATTATNQKDFGGIEAYDKWYRHVTRTMGLAGYQLVKGMGAIAKELSIKSADNTNKVAGIETIKDTVIESGMSLAMGYPSKEQLAKNKKERDMLRKTMDKNSEYYKPIDEDITEANSNLKFNIPKSVRTIHSAFKKNRKKLYIVGGAVRDAILGKSPKDYDLATDAKPDEVIDIAKKNGLKYTEVGKSFGVVVVDDMEIATFRADIGKGRRPDRVEYTDIYGDVKRRDLTINALFYDLDTDEIVDLVGGIKDLQKNKIRTVGNAIERFDEDPLRKLRAIRFTARLGGKLERSTLEAITSHPTLSGVSAERIRDEFIKSIQSAKSVKDYLKIMSITKLLHQCFPNMIWKESDFIEEKNHILLLAYLFRRNTPQNLHKQLMGLKYSADEADAIRFLVQLMSFNKADVFKFKKQQQNTILTDADILRWGNLIGTNFTKFIKFKLSVSGNDVMKLGFRGKDIGTQISKMEADKYINENIKELGITSFRNLFDLLPAELKKRVYDLKNISQRKDYHPEGNTLKHTITVVNRSLKDNDIDIAIAAIFHDIGKDETEKINPKTGQTTHYGHEKVSAELVKRYTKWITELGGNVANIFYIVNNHMRFKQLNIMKAKKVDKLKSFRAYDKLSKFGKHDRGGLGEDITIPVKIGDTILTGKFKNKKVVVTSIGKDERGMPTVNGKKVVNFRLMSEGIYIEMVGDDVVCSNCKHNWKIDDGDENPYLCHKCGWDTKTNTFDYKELNKWKKSVKSVDDIYNESVEELIAEFRAEGILNEIPIGDLQQIDKFADTQLNPFNIVLTGKHFMDRLVDTRNKNPISAAELIGFFKRLSRKKTEFAEFLKKYGEIVAKDNRTKINIPFMKQANNAIAKTIMRKDNFKTPSPELKFEATSRGKMYEPKRIKAYYEALCKSEGVKSLPIKFGSVGKGGAALTFNPKTIKPLYISFDVNRLSDPEFAIIHELTHQIKLETEGDAYVGKRDQLAKFKKLENYLIDKYVYSNYSKLLYEMNFETINEDTIKYISKSLGVSRSKMPQINSKDITDFVKYLKDKGVSVSPSVIDVSKVGMTQKDINVDKVKDLLGVEKSNLAKPVIISKDNYILDGHHRVVALYNIDKNFKLKTIKVDLGIKDLLSVSNQFPKVSFKGITESNITGLSSGNKYQNKVRARRDDDGNLIIENIESNLEKKYGVEADIYEYTDYIELSKVVVPKESRGSGIGTKFMNDLINYAKAKNKDIFLTPSSDFGGSKGRLIQFYKGFGFKNNKGKYRDFRSKNSMVLHIDVE